MKEIEERSLLYEEMKHYFILNFPQRPGALREFVNDVLGPQDDITKFEYLKIISKYWYCYYRHSTKRSHRFTTIKRKCKSI